MIPTYIIYPSVTIEKIYYNDPFNFVLQTNTFQCVLATDGVESFVIFLYAYGNIHWTTGRDSGGFRGLFGTEALAGINAGDSVNSIIINGSLTPEIINIDKTSNVQVPGVWIFQVGKGKGPHPVTLDI